MGATAGDEQRSDAGDASAGGMTAGGVSASAAIEAWGQGCERLAALGRRLSDHDFPAAAADRADGLAHVIEQAICWLSWSVFQADPRRPAFQRQNDLITQWGGPNADNVYRHARVEPGRRYRIRGRMHSCQEFILAVRAGFMHLPTWGTLVEVNASDLGLTEGSEIDFTVGLGGDVDLPEGALTVSIREYYFDWTEAEPATFTIECLDADAAPAVERRTTDAVAAQVREGVDGVAVSLEYWNTYHRDRIDTHPRNTFAPSFALDKGLDAARYCFCFWDLGPDDALIVEMARPASRYWSFQLYELTWFELVDITERQTSLNHTQLAVDGDGITRVVVSHRDPGVPNWLDAGGRAGGHLMLRCFWLEPGPDSVPAPSTRVVPVDDVPGRPPRRHADRGRREPHRADGGPPPPPGVALPHLNPLRPAEAADRPAERAEGETAVTGRLDDEVALVSAAANGIGRAVARRFAAEGAILSLNDIDGEGLADVVDELRRAGTMVDGVDGDASDSGFVDSWVAGVVESHGRIDVLANNVGVSRSGLIADISDEDWHFQQRLTLDTVFYATRAVIPHMVSRQKGSIVSMSSGAGIGGQYNLGGYAAAKAGVINLMETVALEYGPQGVRANAVTPGPTQTAPLLAYLEQQPGGIEGHVRDLDLRRLSQPEEVANTVLWLASSESSNVTGITVRSNIRAASGRPI